MKATKSIPQNQVICETYKFEFSLGHKPKGRGSWAFSFDRQESDVHFFYGYFTDAKKEAIKQAANEGHHTIYALP